jgi:hypothetical protein
VKTPRKRRDGARPAVPPDVEPRPADGSDQRSGTSCADADLPSAADGESAADLSPRQKRLASKAAYRARRSVDDDFREQERERVKEWRLKNRDKTRAQKRKARSVKYHRPFVSINSEGQTYPDDDVLYDGVRYPKHESCLWGAATDDDRPPFWLLAAGTRGLDKQPLQAIQILDWLLSLPEQFGPAIFVMFSFGYDITQILKSLPYEKTWQIEKRETYPDKDGNKRAIGHARVFWKNYAISYIKGKSFDLRRLADPQKPYIAGKLNAVTHIRIYDVFGFFQSSFSAVADSMVQSGRATEEEADYLNAMKGKRSNFATVRIEEIQKYTTLELRLLARMMCDLRNGFDETGLHLRHWHGAGAEASALIEAEKLKEHFGSDIAALNISAQQEAAHHGYFGGRIELLKQGYVENVQLHIYDIASCYPAAMVELPSLAFGQWINQDCGVFQANSLAELRKSIELTSPASMFKIKFQFPMYEQYHLDARKAVFIPFYPLSYRQKGAGILFPANGYGWYMRDDVLAAIAWLERFVADFPRPRKRANQVTSFVIEEAWLFELQATDGVNKLPFSFVEELFRKRRRIKDESEQMGKYDIREKAIKLSLNSIYGKLAQSVGGAEGKAPSVANPYYAAATTAYCRRRLLEAALLDPHAIVSFATDGIVSTRPLTGLARVKRAGDVVDLGDWEYSEANGGLFVMPGVYTYGKVALDEAGARTIEPVTKIRGGDAKKYAAKVKANHWLIENVLAAWRKPFDPRKPETFPRIVAEYQKYITAGNALAARARWKLAGRWTAKPGEPGAGKREIFVHSVGNKRELVDDESEWPDYVSIPGREARRCNGLIRTIPALNNDTALSRPRMPEWMDKDIGRDVEEREEQEEILAGFE